MPDVLHELRASCWVLAQVRKVWPALLAVCPGPEAAASADVEALSELIRPLGFFRFRARAIVAMSNDFMHLDWRRPSELRHIGKYASDAYFIFCRCA
jgi:3-methyladenine DNA glycosylase/8-oxoguanine DNA glycosylase